MIQCSNPHCRALSPLPASCCQTCGTPLHYRFLLAVSDGEPTAATGVLVADRYWVWSSDIWLDTQPDAAVVPLEVLPRFVVPYLRLSALPQYVPRPFTVLTPDEGAVSETVLLLDAAPIGSHLTEKKEVEPFLLPTLEAAWGQGSALQQLNWLRQIAHLWEPLAHQGVASTLLHPRGLRVDSALLRLSRLSQDGSSDQPPTLMALGQEWQTLVPQARPEIQAYVHWLVKALMNEDIALADDLLAELDQRVRTLAAGLSLTVDWVAHTDQGPGRPRNEDACYPEQSLHQVQLMGHKGREIPLLLVCDGIGGHEQGNVASQTAIKILRQELQPLADYPDPSPQLVGEHIHRALALANDAIADRNNDEHRSARARMGTTVVLALVHFPYVSVAHLGDSRAYRISDRTCYQITLDDDIASRETRLGYTLYSEALQIPNSGALIQALGISDSAQLYPNVNHLLIDDPVVLLLCSDGLSDYDRVDMLWRHHLSPLIGHPGALETTGQELIHQANQLNGHDNVTVGLLRLTPQPSAYSPLPGEALHRLGPDAPAMAAAQTATQLVVPGGQQTQPEPAVLSGPKAGFPGGLVLGGTAVAALVALGVAWLYSFRQPLPTAMAPLTLPRSMARVQTNSLEAMTWAAAEAIDVGSFWQAGYATSGRRPQRLELRQRPAAGGLNPVPSAPSASPTNARATAADGVTQPSPAATLVPTGSILKVVGRQTRADESTWVRVQVCAIPSGQSLDQIPQETDGGGSEVVDDLDLNRSLSSPGETGWVPERTLYLAATPLPQPTDLQRGDCNP